ncbi:MAG: addiction module antitoxin RelB [Dehalococcoidia bacterium]|nr:addiction module antitoxin RelB [Dehalococcoidia bacterium]
MSEDPAVVLREALRLPIGARAALAAALLESLETEVDEDAEEAWRIEIQRRVRDLDAGRVQPLPWPEVWRRIAGE